MVLYLLSKHKEKDRVKEYFSFLDIIVSSKGVLLPICTTEQCLCLRSTVLQWNFVTWEMLINLEF